jgi:hypothetical protein
MAKGCEDELLTHHKSQEELRRELEELRTSLQNAFSEYELNKELVGNPQTWVAYIQDAIVRAHCFLNTQKEHPGLEDVFARLAESLHRAEKRLPGYEKIKGIKRNPENTE